MQNQQTISPKKIFTVIAAVLLLALAPLATEAKESVLFILDCSGSMWGQVNGTPKIAAAKESLLSLFSEIPDTMNVGMMAYGHRRKGDCQDIEIIAEFSSPRTDIPSRLTTLNAKGKTPISEALIRAGELVGGIEDPTKVILISDGVETCQGDPCGVAAQLIAKGIKVVIHVVGFDVDTAAADQLECIARAGNGRFFKVDNVTELKESLFLLKNNLITEMPLPEPPKTVAPPMGTAASKTLRIAGPGTVILKPASWVKMPPLSWSLANVETGNVMASGKGDQLRVKAGEYQVIWRQSEHGHVDTLLTVVFKVESGKKVEVPIDTGVRINIPSGMEPPQKWGLTMPGETAPFWTTDEIEFPQVVPAGTYDVFWRQNEHESIPVTLSRITIEAGKLNEIVADSGLFLQPAEWAPSKYYYYRLKNKNGDMAGSWKKPGPQLAPPGEYTLILRPTEHNNSDIEWGAVTVPAHGFAEIPINSGVRFLHAPDAKPPYGIFLKNLDSDQEIVARGTWEPIPAPPGRYRLDWWESEHGSTRQTLMDEFTIGHGALVEMEL
jgi:Ca-activated chloride channel family protein